MKSDRWIEKFFMNAMLQASFSKDNSTKCGAVIVRPNNSICSEGYNGFPRGVNDDVIERHERPQKYFYFEHAERNAIYNSSDPSLDGYSIFVYTNPKKLFVCSACTRGIIQTGIKEIYIPPYDLESYWKDDFVASSEMLNECNIKVNIIDISRSKDLNDYRRLLFKE